MYTIDMESFGQPQIDEKLWENTLYAEIILLSSLLIKVLQTLNDYNILTVN